MHLGLGELGFAPRSCENIDLSPVAAIVTRHFLTGGEGAVDDLRPLGTLAGCSREGSLVALSLKFPEGHFWAFIVGRRGAYMARD